MCQNSDVRKPDCSHNIFISGKLSVFILKPCFVSTLKSCIKSAKPGGSAAQGCFHHSDHLLNHSDLCDDLLDHPDHLLDHHLAEAHRLLTDPHISQGRVTVQPEGALIISPIKSEDAGTYVCEVTNGIGRAQHAPAILEVTCKSQTSPTNRLFVILQTRPELCSPRPSSICPSPSAGSSTVTSSPTHPSSSSPGRRTSGYSTPSTWTR